MFAGQDLICRLDIKNTGTVLLKDVAVPPTDYAKWGSTACNFPSLAPSLVAHCTMLWPATQQDFDNWDQQYGDMASGFMFRTAQVHAKAAAAPEMSVDVVTEITVPLTARPRLSLNATRWLRQSDPFCCGGFNSFSAGYSSPSYGPGYSPGYSTAYSSTAGQSCYCNLDNIHRSGPNYDPRWNRPYPGDNVVVPG